MSNGVAVANADNNMCVLKMQDNFNPTATSSETGFIARPKNMVNDVDIDIHVHHTQNGDDISIHIDQPQHHRGGLETVASMNPIAGPTQNNEGMGLLQKLLGPLMAVLGLAANSGAGSRSSSLLDNFANEMAQAAAADQAKAAEAQQWAEQQWATSPEGISSKAQSDATALLNSHSFQKAFGNKNFTRADLETVAKNEGGKFDDQAVRAANDLLNNQLVMDKLDTAAGIGQTDGVIAQCDLFGSRWIGKRRRRNGASGFKGAAQFTFLPRGFWHQEFHSCRSGNGCEE